MDLAEALASLARYSLLRRSSTPGKDAKRHHILHACPGSSLLASQRDMRHFGISRVCQALADLAY